MTKEQYYKKAEANKKRGLQKFTDNEFLNRLLNNQKIGNDEIDKLTPRQINLFVEKYNSAIDDKKDQLLDVVIDKLPEPVKHNIWEINHSNITNAILDYVMTCGTMPTKSKIAEYTGLSRPTINKHFKELDKNSLFSDHTDQFRMLVPKVMGEVLKQSIQGNIPAAKLFFNVMGCLNNGSNKTIQNNNFIQINNTILKQETIEQLEPEQIKEIEAIVLKNRN